MTKSRLPTGMTVKSGQAIGHTSKQPTSRAERKDSDVQSATQQHKRAYMKVTHVCLHTLEAWMKEPISKRYTLRHRRPEYHEEHTTEDSKAARLTAVRIQTQTLVLIWQAPD